MTPQEVGDEMSKGLHMMKHFEKEMNHHPFGHKLMAIGKPMMMDGLHNAMGMMEPEVMHHMCHHRGHYHCKSLINNIVKGIILFLIWKIFEGIDNRCCGMCENECIRKFKNDLSECYGKISKANKLLNESSLVLTDNHKLAMKIKGLELLEEDLKTKVETLKKKDSRLAIFIQEMAIDPKKMGAKSYNPTTVKGLVRSLKTRGKLAKRALKKGSKGVGLLTTGAIKGASKEVGKGLSQMKEKGNDLLLAAYVNTMIKTRAMSKDVSDLGTASKSALGDSVKGIKLGSAVVKKIIDTNARLKNALNNVMVDYLTDPNKKALLIKNITSGNPISATAGIALGIAANLSVQLNKEFNITGKKLDPKVEKLLTSDRVKNAIGSYMAVYLLKKAYPAIKSGVEVTADYWDDFISFLM